jgi:hypothetical protein
MQALQHEPLYDINPRSGASFEVFYSDPRVETFGRVGAGWFWWPRRRGFSPSQFGDWSVCHELCCLSARDDHADEDREPRAAQGAIKVESPMTGFCAKDGTQTGHRRLVKPSKYLILLALPRVIEPLFSP